MYPNPPKTPFTAPQNPILGSKEEGEEADLTPMSKAFANLVNNRHLPMSQNGPFLGHFGSFDASIPSLTHQQSHNPPPFGAYLGGDEGSGSHGAPTHPRNVPKMSQNDLHVPNSGGEECPKWAYCDHLDPFSIPRDSIDDIGMMSDYPLPNNGLLRFGCGDMDFYDDRNVIDRGPFDDFDGGCGVADDGLSLYKRKESSNRPYYSDDDYANGSSFHDDGDFDLGGCMVSESDSDSGSISSLSAELRRKHFSTANKNALVVERNRCINARSQQRGGFISPPHIIVANPSQTPQNVPKTVPISSFGPSEPLFHPLHSPIDWENERIDGANYPIDPSIYAFSPTALHYMGVNNASMWFDREGNPLFKAELYSDFELSHPSSGGGLREPFYRGHIAYDSPNGGMLDSTGRDDVELKRLLATLRPVRPSPITFTTPTAPPGMAQMSQRYPVDLTSESPLRHIGYPYPYPYPPSPSNSSSDIPLPVRRNRNNDSNMMSQPAPIAVTGGTGDATRSRSSVSASSFSRDGTRMQFTVGSLDERALREAFLSEDDESGSVVPVTDRCEVITTEWNGGNNDANPGCDHVHSDSGRHVSPSDSERSNGAGSLVRGLVLWNPRTCSSLESQDNGDVGPLELGDEVVSDHDSGTSTSTEVLVESHSSSDNEPPVRDSVDGQLKSNDGNGVVTDLSTIRVTLTSEVPIPKPLPIDLVGLSNFDFDFSFNSALEADARCARLVDRGHRRRRSAALRHSSASDGGRSIRQSDRRQSEGRDEFGGDGGSDDCDRDTSVFSFDCWTKYCDSSTPLSVGDGTYDEVRVECLNYNFDTLTPPPLPEWRHRLSEPHDVQMTTKVTNKVDSGARAINAMTGGERTGKDSESEPESEHRHDGHPHPNHNHNLNHSDLKVIPSARHLDEYDRTPKQRDPRRAKLELLSLDSFLGSDDGSWEDDGLFKSESSSSSNSDLTYDRRSRKFRNSSPTTTPPLTSNLSQNVNTASNNPPELSQISPISPPQASQRPPATPHTMAYLPSPSSSSSPPPVDSVFERIQRLANAQRPDHLKLSEEEVQLAVKKFKSEIIDTPEVSQSPVSGDDADGGSLARTKLRDIKTKKRSTSLGHNDQYLNMTDPTDPNPNKSKSTYPLSGPLLVLTPHLLRTLVNKCPNLPEQCPKKAENVPNVPKAGTRKRKNRTTPTPTPEHTNNNSLFSPNTDFDYIHFSEQYYRMEFEKAYSPQYVESSMSQTEPLTAQFKRLFFAKLSNGVVSVINHLIEGEECTMVFSIPSINVMFTPQPDFSSFHDADGGLRRTTNKQRKQHCIDVNKIAILGRPPRLEDYTLNEVKAGGDGSYVSLFDVFPPSELRELVIAVTQKIESLYSQLERRLAVLENRSPRLSMDSRDPDWVSQTVIWMALAGGKGPRYGAFEPLMALINLIETHRAGVPPPHPASATDRKRHPPPPPNNVLDFFSDVGLNVPNCNHKPSKRVQANVPQSPEEVVMAYLMAIIVRKFEMTQISNGRFESEGEYLRDVLRWCLVEERVERRVDVPIGLYINPIRFPMPFILNISSLINTFDPTSTFELGSLSAFGPLLESEMSAMPLITLQTTPKEESKGSKNIGFDVSFIPTISSSQSGPNPSLTTPNENRGKAANVISFDPFSNRFIPFSPPPTSISHFLAQSTFEYTFNGEIEKRWMSQIGNFKAVKKGGLGQFLGHSGGLWPQEWLQRATLENNKMFQKMPLSTQNVVQSATPLPNNAHQKLNHHPSPLPTNAQNGQNPPKANKKGNNNLISVKDIARQKQSPINPFTGEPITDTIFIPGEGLVVDRLAIEKNLIRANVTPKAQKNKLDNRKRQMAKTKVCPWFGDGACKLGLSCNYAHFYEELKPIPDLSCTRMCKELVTTGRCSRSNCRFAHRETQLRATPEFFRTRLCDNLRGGGVCRIGAQCRFAHSMDELRSS